MLTVGQITQKISLLRSKIAVTEGVVLYLKAHFMPSDAGDAEMSFTRSDHGKVPSEHVEKTIADYVEYLDTIKNELARLEEVPVTMSTPEATPKLVSSASPKSKRPAKPAPKEAPSGTQRGDQDQPAAQRQAVGGGNG